jgi:endonuclease/exonuclease/phosphatase family metal-dependent hydrolase
MMQRTTCAAGCWRVRALTAIVLTLTLSNSALAADDKTAIRVMTRNMDSGTDLLLIFAATDFPSFVRAMAATYSEINASNIPRRAGRLADEIASAQPDLIGLQEVTLWRTGPLNNTPATIVLYDQLQLLLAELAQRNLHYSLVAAQSLVDAQAPDIADGINLRVTDRNAVLVRTDLPPGHLDILNVQAQRYAAVLNITNPVLGVIPNPRGFIAAEVKVRGAKFRFVTTHLESLSPDPATTTIQVQQANELITAFSSASEPVIIAGDFNANADLGRDHTAATVNLLAAGFLDAWRTSHPSELGSTWPLYFEDQFAGTPVAPFERIDLIFGRATTILDAEQTGLTPIYGSDHVGLVATLLPEK